MKKILYFAMLWMSIMCVSCNGRGNEPEIDPILLAEIKQTSENVIACLSNNYTDGDTIFFQDSQGNKETFTILTSYDIFVYFDIEIEDPKDENDPGKWERSLESMSCEVYMQRVQTSEVLRIAISVYLLDGLMSNAVSQQGLAVEAFMSLSTKDDSSLIKSSILTHEDDSQIPADQLWIQTPTALSCKLKRNVGIIAFTDNEQNTWTLVK